MVKNNFYNDRVKNRYIFLSNTIAEVSCTENSTPDNKESRILIIKQLTLETIHKCIVTLL